jgi:orotidine-5'-phosphate decarboxylase
MNTPKVYLALDNPDFDYCQTIVEKLKPAIDGVKLGLEFYTSNGHRGLEKIQKSELPVFLDLKLHDIPNTIFQTSQLISRMNIDMFTIHVMGGKDMINAALAGAYEGATKNNIKIPRVLGVTVLTSLDDSVVKEIGFPYSTSDLTLRLAQLAKTNGLSSFVCSGQEITPLKNHIGKDTYCVIPGIRLLGDNTNDQSRTITPENAQMLGADLIVVGRSILKSADPLAVALKIKQNLNNQLTN